MSRAYYCVFVKARNLKCPPSTKHRDVFRFYEDEGERARDNRLISISTRLKSFYEQRCKADYHDTLPDPKWEAVSAIERAEEILVLSCIIDRHNAVAGVSGILFPKLSAYREQDSRYTGTRFPIHRQTQCVSGTRFPIHRQTKCISGTRFPIHRQEYYQPFMQVGTSTSWPKSNRINRSSSQETEDSSALSLTVTCSDTR